MKKLFILMIAVLLFAGSAWATTGSCVVTYEDNGGSNIIAVLKCTGGSDGSVSDTSLSAAMLDKIEKGPHFLYAVSAKPTDYGTLPNGGTVAVLKRNKDLLGGKGASIIPSTATENFTMPYSSFMSTYFYPVIDAPIAVHVTGQTTAGANFTIYLYFER